MISNSISKTEKWELVNRVTIRLMNMRQKLGNSIWDQKQVNAIFRRLFGSEEGLTYQNSDLLNCDFV